MTINHADGDYYLSIKDLAKRFGVCLDTLYKWRRKGAFPCGSLLGSNCRRWKMSEILEWERSRQAKEV